MGYTFGVGRKAPAFVRKATDGTTISLAAFRGDWYPILVFVPGPCAQAFGLLSELDASAGRVWGLRGQLLGICHSGLETGDPAEGGALSFPLLCDDGSLAASYGVRVARDTFTPSAFIVDRAGKIVWTGEGRRALDPAVLEKALRDVAR